MIQWGGEIVNNHINGQHTTTEMGSGHFAEEEFGKASAFLNIEILDAAKNFISPKDFGILMDHESCYNIKTVSNDYFGTHFYYGGPGLNSICQ
ncbi:putative neprosin [Lupinus albus]|uniref:Putative neprosin n=1 Tax=Lupinus albus TaxID=3870 RepID=A0A6A4NEA0_LUPAL|nr:putative neprosin [Lupinus albus]